MIRRGSDSPIRRSTYIAYACPLAGLAGKSNQEPAQLKGLDKFTHTMAAPFAQDFGDFIWPKRDARAREASSALGRAAAMAEAQWSPGPRSDPIVRFRARSQNEAQNRCHDGIWSPTMRLVLREPTRKGGG